MIIPGPDNRFFKVLRALFYGWVVVLVLSMYPYTEDPATPIKSLVTACAAMLLGVLWVAGILLRLVPVRPASLSVQLLVAFLVWQGARALGSDNVARSILALAPWLASALLAYIAFQLFTHTRHVRDLFRVIVAAVALSSLYGLLQHAGVDPFPWAFRTTEEYRALPATYGNPNFAGHTLVVAIILAIALIVETPRRAKRRGELSACLLAAALLFTHLYLTHMRGAVVALIAAGVALAIALLLWQRGRTRLAGWGTGIAIVVTLLLVAGGALFYWAPSRIVESSLQLRLHSYLGAAAMFADHWAVGVGPGNYSFQTTTTTYWTDFEALWYALEGRRNIHVHNEWLEIAAESGVLGIFLFLFLGLSSLLIPLQRPLQLTPLQIAIPVALFAMLVDACFGFNVHVPVSGSLFFLLLLLQPDNLETGEVPDATTRRFAPLLLPLAGLCLLLQAWHFQGERYYQQGKGALAWAQEQTAPNDAKAYTDAAHERFRAAEAWQPWDHRAPIARGNLALQKGHGAEAVAALTIAHARHPNLPRLQMQLGRAYLLLAQEQDSAGRQGALDEAIRLATTATTASPALGDAWAVLGWAYWLYPDRSPEQLDRSIDALRTARAQGVTRDAALDFSLSQAYALKGDHDRAASAMIRAVNLRPEEPTYWMGFRALAAKTPSIQRAYRQSIRSHLVAREIALPDSLQGTLAHYLADSPAPGIETQVSEAVLRHAVSDRPTLLALWTAWLRVLPETEAAEAFVSLSNAAARDTTLPPPIMTLRDVLTTNGRPTFLRNLANALAWPPQWEAPDAMTRDAAALRSLIPTALEVKGSRALQRGRIAFYAGDFAAADRLLQRAVTEVPEAKLAEVYFYRSRALAHLGQAEVARTLAQEAFRRQPNDLQYPWNLALRLAESGERAAARFQLDILLTQSANDPAINGAIRVALQSLPKDANKEGDTP